MCLSHVSSNEHAPSAEGVGWKVLKLMNGQLYPAFRRTGLDNDVYELNQWYETYDFRDSETAGYWRGFHIFRTLVAAKQWLLGGIWTNFIIRKVRWRYRLAIGKQSCASSWVILPCVVAKEILILPERKKVA